MTLVYVGPQTHLSFRSNIVARQQWFVSPTPTASEWTIAAWYLRGDSVRDIISYTQSSYAGTRSFKKSCLLRSAKIGPTDQGRSSKTGSPRVHHRRMRRLPSRVDDRPIGCMVRWSLPSMASRRWMVRPQRASSRTRTRTGTGMGTGTGTGAWRSKAERRPAMS